MPGGPFGWETFGEDFPEVGTGSGIAPLGASGAKQTDLNKTGTAASAFSASSPKGNDVARSNVAIAPFSASGTGGYVRIKAGTAELDRTGTGDGRWTLAQSNRSTVFPRSGLGMGHTVGGANEKSVSRVGLAKSIFTAHGRRGDAVAGRAQSAFVGSGAITEKVVNRFNNSGGWFGNQNRSPYRIASGRSDTVMTETGFTVRGVVASGDSRVTYVEAGTATSPFASSGVPGKPGTASAPFSASGADATTFSESGTAVAPFIGRGEAQPGGVAVVEFTGGGTWKSLYANDNFAGRELIDAPTGDIDLDAGPRSWLLAGATDRATNETGEDLTLYSGINMTKTLWWELRVPFPCIVLLDVNDSANRSIGNAQRGTAVNATQPYAWVDDHFGQMGGRGWDGRRTNSGDNNQTSGAFPHIFIPQAGNPVVVQMDPETPMVLSVGRQSTIGYEIAYQVSIERLEPPENDGPDSATEIDVAAGGSISYDLHAATGDRRWNWANLESWISFPSSYKLGGDLFYLLRPTTDGVFRFTATQTVAGATVKMMLFHGTDIDTWEPVQIRHTLPTSQYSPYDTEAASAYYTEVALTGGENYVLALLTMRSVFYYETLGVYLQATPTPRGAGVFAWEFVDAAPTNDDIADRVLLSGAYPIVTSVADTRGSTQEVGEPDDRIQRVGKGVWYEHTPATSGWFTLYPGTEVYEGRAAWDLYRGDPTDFSPMELAYETILTLYNPVQMRAGDTYYIRLSPGDVGSTDHGTVTLDLAQANVAANDDFSARTAISGDAGDLDFDCTGSTSELGEPVPYYWDFCQLPSVWFEWTPPYTGDFQFKTTSPYAALGLYTGTSIGSLTPLARYETYGSVDLRIRAQAGTPVQIQYAVSPDTVPADPAHLAWRPTTIPSNTSKATAVPLALDGTTVISHNGSGTVAFVDEVPDVSSFLFTNIFGEQTRIGRPVWYRIDPPFSGDYTFTLSSTNWDAAAMVLHDSAGTLELALDSSDSEAVLDFSYYDGYTTTMEARLTAGEVYYLVVFAFASPNQEPDWSGPVDLLWADDMFAQGEFTASATGINLGDSLQDVSNELIDAFNLDYFAHYVWLDADGGDEGPLYSYTSGGCREASNIGATAQVGEPPAYPGWPATSTVWFHWRSGGAGDYEFWIEPAGVQPISDPMMAVYFSTFGGGVGTLGAVLAQSDNFNGLFPRVVFNVPESAVHYVIQVDGRDQGTFTLKWRRIPENPAPANDDFADAIEIFENTPVSGTTAGASVECGETPIAAWYEGPFGSVWYVFNPTQSGTLFLTAQIDLHTGGWYTAFDVYQGTSLDTLVNITPANTYSTGGNNATIGFPVTFAGGVPVYIRASTEFDGVYYTGFGEPEGDTFSISVDVGSPTPPTGDDADDAIDSPGGVTPGSTDGATLQPGEPDPIHGGTLNDNDPLAGTVWHRYVPDAPGFVDIYTTRTGLPPTEWYAVGVWEGASAGPGAKMVKALAQDPSIYPYRTTGALPCHFEVRADQTYWIQVVRRGDQSWGDYDLHIVEYLERVDWSADTDGFTSTTGAPTFSGGTMTCTGSQAIADLLDVLPQYKTIDLGAIPAWAREVRIYFEVRVIGGQVVRREMWYGGNDWSFANAASDDHVNLTMRRLGLLRARDTGGNQRLVVSLADNNNGENTIEATTASNACSSNVSLGVGGPQHNDGWCAVELILNAQNYQYNDGSHPSANTYPFWNVRMLVDGQPVDDIATFTGTQIRYLDFGMFRHPSMILANDQYYAENNEAWTYEMRRMRVTNIVPREAYTVEFGGAPMVHEFDGFPNGTPFWSEPNRHYAMQAIGGGSQLYSAPANFVDAPDRPGVGALHTVAGMGSSSTELWYGFTTGSRRFFGLSTRVASFSTGGEPVLAGYENFMSLFTLQGQELFIHPFGRQFCVAHPAVDQWLWIESHVDSEVMWDVRCTVFINGVSFGTYSNSYSWQEVAAGTGMPAGYVPAAYADYDMLRVGQGLPNGTEYEGYFTNIVSGIGSGGTMLGPLRTELVAAATDALPHHLPDEPGDVMDLPRTNEPYKIYGWMYEQSNAGPVVGAGSTHVSLGVTGPRFWEAFYEHQPTGPGSHRELRQRDESYISGTSLSLTRFGQSVPIDVYGITGIEVTVCVQSGGATLQLLKAGSPVGTSTSTPTGTFEGGTRLVFGGATDMWGTTWTPQEVNALDFGVQLTGAGNVDQVTVKVYFDDYGLPLSISRGGILAPEGLYNLYGDTVVVELTLSGTGGVEWPTGGWEPGGFTGSSGDYKWSSLYPLWLWQARGDKVPYLNNGTGTATDIRIVRNPLIYPRYAWSADDGATWTWVYPGDEDTVDHIGSDISATTTDAVFLDNAAPLDRWQSHKGGWSSGLNQDRPTASPAYRYMYWHLQYTGGSTTETSVLGVNLWTRFRPFRGDPRTETWRAGNFSAYSALPNGDTQKVGRYSIDIPTSYPNPAPTNSDAVTKRFTQPRAPDGTAWSPTSFNALRLRLGFNQNTTSNSFALYGRQDRGAAVYAAAWEILVPDAPTTPPTPCEQIIDLSMARMIPGAGDPTQPGIAAGVDLSDVRYAPGAEQNPTGGTTGVDLTDVLFAPGASSTNP